MTPVRLSVLVLFLIFSSLHGQILVGPVVGSQFNMFSYDDKGYKDYYSVKPSISWHAGGSIAFKIHKTFFLQSSLLYNERKKTMEGKVDQLFSHEVKYQFLDIPILFTKEVKAKIGHDKYYKWYLGVGPNISYWLGGKGVLKNSDLNENVVNPPNYDLPYKITFYKAPEDVVQGEMNVEKPNRYQLGLNFSAGVIFEPVDLNKFMITARYQLGHSFMSANSQGDFGLPGKLFYADDLRFRNQTIALSVYYFVDLKTSERKRGKSTIKQKNKR